MARAFVTADTGTGELPAIVMAYLAGRFPTVARILGLEGRVDAGHPTLVDYGAVPGEDATDALQAAGASGRRVIVSGDWTTSPFTLSVPGTELVADGDASITAAAGSTGHLVTVTADDCGLVGLELDNGGRSSASAVWSTATRTKVKRCTVRGQGTTESRCVVMQGGSDGLVERSRVFGIIRATNHDRVTVDRSWVYSPEHGGDGMGVAVQATTLATNHSHGATITDNYFQVDSRDFAVSPISRDGAERPRGTLIEGNTFDILAADAYGAVSVDNCVGGKVADNIVRLGPAGGWSAGIEVVISEGVNVTDNDVDCGGRESGAIVLNRSSGCHVADNHLRNLVNDVNAALITLTVPHAQTNVPQATLLLERNTIQDNYLDLAGAAGRGVYFYAGTFTGDESLSIRGNSVIGNTIMGGSPDHTATATGVWMDGTAAHAIVGTVIAGNRFLDILGAVGGKYDQDTRVVDNTTNNVDEGFRTGWGSEALAGDGIILEGNSWQVTNDDPNNGGRGVHFTGERTIITDPTSAFFPGWVCTAGGRPGTWVALPRYRRSGTSAERPQAWTVGAGHPYWNSELGVYQVSDGTGWVTLATA